MTTRFSFLLLIAVLFIVTLTSAQNAASTSIREKAEGSILKMYYDLSALPIKDAKASFRNALSNDKSELWRTHLALFLVRRPQLNEKQKKVILAAMSLATPEFFEMRSSDPGWKTKVREPLRSLEEQIASAFSRQDAVKIFATLGDNTESANCGATYARSVLLKNINYQRPAASCECSTVSDWCPISGYCSAGNCNPTQSGCGTFWTYPCNGVCR